MKNEPFLHRVFLFRLNKRSDDSLLLQAIKEEREFKKQCLELLADSNHELKTSSREFMQNINSISQSMNEGFSMIRNIMAQQFLIQSYNLPTANDSNSFESQVPPGVGTDLPGSSHIVIPPSPTHDSSSNAQQKDSPDTFTFRINRNKLS